MSAARHLAIVTVGSTTVGIDMAMIMQALTVPPALAPLPRRRGALAGIVDCAGQLVPVVDLARWVETGVATADPASRRILILRHGARRIGMLADTIEGFADVAAGTVTRLHHDDDPDEVFHCAATVPATGAIACILAVDRLAALACAWHDDGAGSADAGVADAGSADAGVADAEAAGLAAAAQVTCAVLQAGTTLLAVPAVRLAEVVACPVLEHVGGGSATFCRWQGRHVPVVDVMAGSGRPVATWPLLAVVEYERAVLGMLVDAALDMRALVPPADGAIATIHEDAGTVLEFVDVAALFARHPESAISIPSSDTDTARMNASEVNDAAQLIFDARGTLATPLAAVQQVLPFDADGPIATMPWNGQAIPMVDLRGRAGQGTILIVRDGAAHLAYVVEGVRSLVPAGQGRQYCLLLPGQSGPTRFIGVPEGGSETSYRIVDLAEEAGFRQRAGR